MMKTTPLLTIVAFAFCFSTAISAKDKAPKAPDDLVKDPLRAIEGAWIHKLDDGAHRMKF